jgi:phosphatidylserine/phosphatidylglycerophosphate/cardiolipin synthase-like enzyme
MVELSPKELEFLLRAVRKGQLPAPITRLSLKSVGKEQLFDRLGPLSTAPRDLLLWLLEMALSRGTGVATSHQSAAHLAWTGPLVAASPARQTTVLVLELFAGAESEVVVVGYEFDHGAVLFEPLHRVMKARAVRVSIFLDVPPPTGGNPMASHLAFAAHRFLQRNWPFGKPQPDLYYMPDGTNHDTRASLHAKCIVVDRKRSLVGSANFTKRGHSRNLEVGVALDDPVFAQSLATQFWQLVESGHLAQLPAPSLPSALPPEMSQEEERESRPALLPTGEARANELYVSEAARPLFARLFARGLPEADVGDDLESETGQVLGTAELSWARARVAVLLAEQEPDRKALEAAGWFCFSLEEASADLDALCAHVERGE